MIKTFQTRRSMHMRFYILTAGLFLFLGWSVSSCKNDARVVVIDAEADVARIVLVLPDTNTITLHRMGQGKWLVNNTYKANIAAVETLVSRLRRFTIKKPVSLANEQSVNDMLMEQGVTVEVYEQTHWIRLPFNTSLIKRMKLHRTYTLGQMSSKQEGTYVRMAHGTQLYEVQVPGAPSGIFGAIRLQEHLWRDPMVVDLDARQIRSVEVHVPQKPEDSFLLIRGQDQANEIQMFDAWGGSIDKSQLDTVKLERYLLLFKGLQHEQFLTGEALQQGLDEIIQPPFIEMTICDVDGHCLKLSCFHRPNQPHPGSLYVEELLVDPNRFYMQIDDGDYTLSQFFVFNRILRPLSFFLRRPDRSQ